MGFSQKLRELRIENDLTQDQLAAKTGLSHGCIAMLEIGKRAPTGQTLETLADFFQCSIDYLLGRSDDLGVISIKNEKSPPALSTEEQELLDMYRALGTKNKLHVYMYAKLRLEEQEENPTSDFARPRQRRF